jgi:hypothetical protein
MRTDFFSTLTGCLASICKNGGLSTVTLAPPVSPDAEHARRSNIYESDILLLNKGVPLLAVFLRYTCSNGLCSITEPGYPSVPAYAGASSLADVQNALGERLRAATMVEPVATPEPTFNEGEWTMALRTPTQAVPLVFQGSPLDIEAIDRAFTALVDVLLARLPPTAAPKV